MVLEVTDQTFDKEVLKSPVPVLVDLWAPWCGPCRSVGPVVEALSEKNMGKLKFCKVNVDENQRTASAYNVMSIPTLIFFKNGKAVDTVVGAVPEAVLQQKINNIA